LSGALVADTGGLLRALARKANGKPAFPDFESALTFARLVLVPRSVQQPDRRDATLHAGRYTWLTRSAEPTLASKSTTDLERAAVLRISTAYARARHVDERRVRGQDTIRRTPDLCSGPVILLQQTAESCPTCDRPLLPKRRVEDQESVLANGRCADGHQLTRRQLDAAERHKSLA